MDAGERQERIRPPVRFVERHVAADAAVGVQLHMGERIAPPVRRQDHRGQAAARPVGGQRRGQVDRGDDLRVDQEERAAAGEAVAQRRQRAGGEQDRPPLLGKMEPEGATVVGGHRPAHRVGQVMEVDGHILHAPRAQPVEQVVNQRPAEHRQAGFGDFVAERTQPRGIAGRENHRRCDHVGAVSLARCRRHRRRPVRSIRRRASSRGGPADHRSADALSVVAAVSRSHKSALRMQPGSPARISPV